MVSTARANGVRVASISGGDPLTVKDQLEAFMNRLVRSVIALVGGCLWAQTQQGLIPKTKTTTWKGTLVDSGCRSQQKNTSDSNSYPAGPARTSYGLIIADGKCVPFDVGSNEKVMGMLKIRKDWSENTVKIKPRKVEVVGTENGGEISVDEIQFTDDARQLPSRTQKLHIH